MNAGIKKGTKTAERIGKSLSGVAEEAQRTTKKAAKRQKKALMKSSRNSGRKQGIAITSLGFVSLVGTIITVFPRRSQQLLDKVIEFKAKKAAAKPGHAAGAMLQPRLRPTTRRRTRAMTARPSQPSTRSAQAPPDPEEGDEASSQVPAPAHRHPYS